MTQDELKLETIVKPWEDKKDNEAIFRKHIYIGNDGEEHYDVIDMERHAQRAVRRITDHQEIVKQYQKVVRAYNNYMRDHPWMTEGLMQDNCRLGDLLKDEKRKSQLKYELGRLMGEYAVPLPLGNFSLNNKETRRLELWKNCRGMWFDQDMLKDEKRKIQFKYQLGRLMGEYAVPLPLGNFSLNNKETRRLELWKNRRGM